MIKNNKINVTERNALNFKSSMNWNIYYRIMNYYNGNDYRSLRLRIAILLLAVTRARISEILVLKVGCLNTLQEKFLIKVGNQLLFIQNQKIRKIILERKKDIKFINAIKTENDFIFTTDLNRKTPLRRESFTKSVNKAIQFIGKNLEPPIYLSSKSFKKWDEKN